MLKSPNLVNLSLAAVVLAANFCFAGEAEPDAPKSGIGFGPGQVTAGNVPLGREIDPNIEFEVHNHAPKPKAVIIKPMRPAESGLTAWEKGYSPIPEPAWLRLEKDEVEVPAKGIVKVKGFLNIPDKPENYNRKWLIGVICESKPPKGTGGAGINLRIISRVGVETVTSTDVDGSGGQTGLIPSILRIDGKPGQTHQASFKIRNNAKAAVTFTPKRFADLESDSEKHARYYGPGREPVHATSWLGTLQPIALAPSETKEIKLSITVPKDAIIDKIYEELLFLQDESKNLEFVRVRTAIAKP